MQFRDDELKQIQGNTVVLISGRLRVAREQLKNLDLRSKLLKETDVKVIVSVRAEWEGGKSSGLGVSVIETEKTHMKKWAVHLAETRARHRALAAAGIAPELYGSEEFSGEDEPCNGKPRGLPPSPNAPPPMNAAQSSASTPPPALAKGRKEIGDEIMRQVGSDVGKARAIIHAIVPGKESPATLTDQEVEIAKLVLKAALVCDSPDAVRAAKLGLQSAIKSQTPVEQWTAEHVKAAWERMGGNHPRPGHSANDVEPPF